MTEDDTFLRLRQISNLEMHVLWRASPNPVFVGYIEEHVPDDVKSFFAQYGWKYTDWVNSFHV